MQAALLTAYHTLCSGRHEFAAVSFLLVEFLEDAVPPPAGMKEPAVTNTRVKKEATCPCPVLVQLIFWIQP